MGFSLITHHLILAGKARDTRNTAAELEYFVAGIQVGQAQSFM